MTELCCICSQPYDGDSTIMYNNDRVEITFGYESRYDGDMYAFTNGYVWRNKRRYIYYPTKDQVLATYPYLSDHVCDNCVSSMIKKGLLRCVYSNNCAIRDASNVCDLCGFSCTTKTLSHPFFPVEYGEEEDKKYCENRFSKKNTICTVISESRVPIIEGVSVAITRYEHTECYLGDYKNETLMWNLGVPDHPLITDNMDLCRTCVQNMIDKGYLISDKMMEDIYNIVETSRDRALMNLHNLTSMHNAGWPMDVILIDRTRDLELLLRKRDVLMSVIRKDLTDEEGRSRIEVMRPIDNT